MKPYLEKALHKNRASGVAQGVVHEFKPQYRTKKKKKDTKILKSPNIKENGYILKTIPIKETPGSQFLKNFLKFYLRFFLQHVCVVYSNSRF
jgi:hypothetical protein